MKLIVGLGNVGREYEATRHNAGFWWVDRLAADERAAFRHESRFHGELARVAAGGADLWLLKPGTFMNASGRAVGAVARFYRIAPQEVLVVHDELDLPPGGVKLKLGGGVSGHNGLKDIAGHLQSLDFWRLRLGIGHPGDRSRVVDYVLGAPRAEDREQIRDAIERSLAVWPLLAQGRMDAATMRLHTRPRPAPAAEPPAGSAADSRNEPTTDT